MAAKGVAAQVIMKEQRTGYALASSINVSAFIEKKNDFSYLTWTHAVDQLLRLDPTATWEWGFFGEECCKVPYCNLGNGAMVFCKVTAFGVTRMAHLPILTGGNKVILNPNAFDVNTAMMRCLAKGIALHGLGLSLYAGEDLPFEAKETFSNLANELRMARDKNNLDEVIALVIPFVKDYPQYKKALQDIKNARLATLEGGEPIGVKNDEPGKGVAALSAKLNQTKG